MIDAMVQRSRCPSCNRNETFAGYFCEKCSFSWEEEALLEPDGTIRKCPCPRCLKITPAEHVRCGNTACMAVWPPPEP
ncbi:MAG: hypothetical protein ABIK44_02985 [candidate division WOR-3 bacterium]